MTTTLIACSHGTSSDSGRAAISALVAQVQSLVGDIPVAEAFVDVQEPHVADVVTEAIAHGTAVVVPLLLSTGFHTKVDIARAVSAYPGRAVAAAPLGPHELVTGLLVQRLAEVGVGSGDAVVLAAAGSSDPEASLDVAATARELSAVTDRPIAIAAAAGVGERIDAAVSRLRDAGAPRVVALSYVLAPGFFADVVARSGADVVTAPLAPDERLAQVVVDRYRAAVGAVLAGRPSRDSRVRENR